MNPLVSIIIPSYNHKLFINELLISIKNQTYKNIEIIIVDDGSADGSVELLNSIREQYNFRLIIKENGGICSAINTGLDYIDGKFVMIIASDDLIPSNRIQEQVSIMLETPFDLIAGGITEIDVDSNVISYFKPEIIGEIFLDDILKRNSILAPSAMFRASVFEKYGRYDPNFIIEDYPMWIKILSKKGRIANFDFNWAYYRRDNSNFRKKIDWYYKGSIQALKQSKNPLAKLTLNKLEFIYFFKVAILDGRKSLGTFKTLVSSDRFTLKSYLKYIVLVLLASAPAIIRKKIKFHLLRIKF